MRGNQAVFSVILAHYCQPDYWKDAVDSVLNQDYPAIELIFADDGTPGFCPEDVETYIIKHQRENLVRFQVFTNSQNVGTVRNLNKAHAMCSGEYRMNFAADDALFDSTVLSRFAAALQKKGQDRFGVYGAAVCCEENLEPTGCLFAEESVCLAANRMSARQQIELLAQNCFILMGGAAFFAKDFDTLLPYDEAYRLIEDWPFLLRVTRGGRTMEFLDFPALKYRTGGVSQQAGNKTLSPAAVQCFYDHIRLLETEILPAAAQMPYREAHKIWRRYDGDRYYLDGVIKTYPTKGQRIISRLDKRVIPERLAYYCYRHKTRCLLLIGILLIGLLGCHEIFGF